MKYVTHARIIEELVGNIVLAFEKTYGKTIPIPIPVIDIAERIFHLKVDLEVLKEKSGLTSGIVIPEKRWIILNKQMEEGRINFTAAHELGHLLIDSITLGLKYNQEFLTYPLASRNQPFERY